MCTQSRPLNVESSYESVTILHASSSVRCAANTPGSGLIGTLRVHDALSGTQGHHQLEAARDNLCSTHSDRSPDDRVCRCRLRGAQQQAGAQHGH